VTAHDSPDKAPGSRGLSPRSLRLRSTLLEAHVYLPHELELLDRALEQNDLADECTAIIRREGLQVEGKAHPLLGARRDALLMAARYWRQLKFDPPQPRRAGRPKGESWSAPRAAAAQVRRLGAEL